MATDTADSTVTHKRATVHPEKADAVAELAEAFRTSAAAVLTEYRGLTVKQLQELRRAMGASTSYSVSKNTLTKLAARDAGLTDLDALLSGPTAVAFVHGDPVEAAKGLRDFGRANPALVVKGGVMDGKSLTADEIRRLADLESREVLLAKLAGAMKASLSQAVYLLNAPLSQAARVLGALQTKAAADPSILAGGAGTPAAAAESADTSAEVVDAGTEGADAQADTDPGSSDASSEPAGTDAAAETSEPVASSDGADSTASTESAEASDATDSTESTSTDGTSTESSSTEDA